MKTNLVTILLVASFVEGITYAQNAGNSGESVPVRVFRIAEKINFDGIPDEAAWSQAEAFPLVMCLPQPGAAPSETSIIRIAYDDEYFYVSGIMNHGDITHLRAIGKQRDYSSLSSDWFGFTLDSYNDRENGIQFITNPNELRRDATIKDDCLVEDNDLNRSWDTFWDVKTRIGDQGWSAEFRIPLSSLRFQNIGGKTLMGILFVRWMAAKSELNTFPAVSPKYASAWYKPSLSQLIEFEGLKPRKPVYIAPYIIAGAGQANVLNDDESGYEMNTTPKFDAGGDIKYSITNNLTLDLTVNTDFAQVEADNQIINLTRYSLYFPEKRKFFLEKSDVFDFSFLDGDNLFYSRRIGLYSGNAVRIYGGGRITGRIGEWDLGFLDMQTAKFEENPGENFGALRLKRDVINLNSCVGAMVTTRLGTDGYYNLTYGLDGRFWVKNSDYLIFRVAQTLEDGSDNRILDKTPTRLLLQWQRPSQVGLGYDIQYSYSGDDYNPGIGFERKKSYHGPKALLSYGWLPEEGSSLYTHRLSLSGYNYWNSASGNRETTNVRINWYWQTKSAAGGNITFDWFNEDLAYDLPLGNYQTTVPAGKYSFANLTLSYQSALAKALSSSLQVTGGSFFGGWRISFYAEPKYKIGTDFDLGVTYYLDNVSFPERDDGFTNHILGIRGLMTLTTKTSLGSFIQYNTAVSRVLANFRFRYNPVEGNDLWIVYDEGLNTNTGSVTPELPYSSGRTILVKYTYSFRL